MKISDPANGTLVFGADGSFVYTPNANFSGTDSFTYQANDFTAPSNTATVTINVTAVNDGPSANAQAVSVNEGGSTGITLTASDVDSGTLTFTVIDGPAHGTLTGTAPDLTYTPNADFNGSDSLTFSVNDGTLDSNVATVSVAVNAVNDVPSFTKGADQSMFEDTGAQTIANWATAISAGPAAFAGQMRPSTQRQQRSVQRSRRLPPTARSATTWRRTRTARPPFRFNSDDGGTASGGADTSAVQTFRHRQRSTMRRATGRQSGVDEFGCGRRARLGRRHRWTSG
jgi:hypothetical protein